MPETAAGRILSTSIAIARSAPAKRAKYVSSAQIPWDLIEQLRDHLDAARIEWRPRR